MPIIRTRRAALVTGASYGIGAAIAMALAKDGCDVAITDLRPADLAATTAAIEAGGGRAVPISLDLRDQGSVEAGFAQAVEAFGGLDLLVNNAGIPMTRPAVDITRAEWEAALAVNLTGTFFICQQMGRHLIGAGRPGRSSAATGSPLPAPAKRAAYSSPLGSVIGQTR